MRSIVGVAPLTADENFRFSNSGEMAGNKEFSTTSSMFGVLSEVRSRWVDSIVGLVALLTVGRVNVVSDERASEKGTSKSG